MTGGLDPAGWDARRTSFGTVATDYAALRGCPPPRSDRRRGPGTPGWRRAGPARWLCAGRGPVPGRGPTPRDRPVLSPLPGSLTGEPRSSARQPRRPREPRISALPPSTDRPAGPGVFLVFEGGEGAGKSTQVDRLLAWLNEQGRTARGTREPGATAIGVRIRQIVLDPANTALSSRAEALLYAADRAQHVHEVLRPALAAGEVVVTDRYVDSSLAYQGVGRTIPVDDVRAVSRWATEGLLPDLTLLLDLPPEVGLARARGRSAADRLEAESLDFHQRVRATFLALAAAEPARYLVLDALQTPDELAAVIRDRVGQLLTARSA